MTGSKQQAKKICFGPFEADFWAQELRRQGIRLRIAGQPFQILRMLLERPGELVSREELRNALWPSDTFVDFEHGLGAAVNKLRRALSDDPGTPRYIETLPRRGYRFIAPVAEATPELAVPIKNTQQSSPVRRSPKLWVAVAVGGVTLFVIGGASWLRRPARQPGVLGYRQLTTDRQLKGRSCAGFRSRIVSDGARVYFSEERSGLLQVSASGGDVIKVRNPFECFLVHAISPDKTELLGAAWTIESATDPPLWALSPVSGSVRRIGNLNGHAGAWSPDGTRIVFATGTKWEGPDDLYIADNDGSNAKKILRIEQGRIEGIAWSPDTKVLRMVVSGQVWEVAVDGSNLHPMDLVSVNDGSLQSPEWTPDGKYFVMGAEKAVLMGSVWTRREKPRLWERNPSQATAITSEAMAFLYPTLSPDEKKIFAVGGRARGELVRYDAKVGKLEPFLGGISAEHLDFSRDGQWVTYVTFPEGILWKSRVDGSERMQLSTPPLRVTLPKWSPDGTRIAFSGMLPDGHFQIYIVSSGGGKAEPVYKSASDQVDEAWTADGNSLIFGCSIFANEKKILSLDLRTKKISSLLGSEGMFSPRLSPDNRHVVAYDMNHDARLALFDRKTQKWSVLTDGESGIIQWSRESTYLYCAAFKGPRLVLFSRLRIANRRVETLGKLDLPGGRWESLAHGWDSHRTGHSYCCGT